MIGRIGWHVPAPLRVLGVQDLVEAAYPLVQVSHHGDPSLPGHGHIFAKSLEREEGTQQVRMILMGGADTGTVGTIDSQIGTQYVLGKLA